MNVNSKNISFMTTVHSRFLRQPTEIARS